jgi:hypothetical protein
MIIVVVDLGVCIVGEGGGEGHLRLNCAGRRILNRREWRYSAMRMNWSLESSLSDSEKHILPFVYWFLR